MKLCAPGLIVLSALLNLVAAPGAARVRTDRTAETTQPMTVTRSDLALSIKDPKIIVIKSKRVLYLYSAGKIVKTYSVGLGSDPINDKTRQGDRCTPEGEFYVCVKNERSKFYLSLGLSYPNVEKRPAWTP